MGVSASGRYRVIILMLGVNYNVDVIALTMTYQ